MQWHKSPLVPKFETPVFISALSTLSLKIREQSSHSISSIGKYVVLSKFFLHLHGIPICQSSGIRSQHENPMTQSENQTSWTSHALAISLRSVSKINVPHAIHLRTWIHTAPNVWSLKWYKMSFFVMRIQWKCAMALTEWCAGSSISTQKLKTRPWEQVFSAHSTVRPRISRILNQVR